MPCTHRQEVRRNAGLGHPAVSARCRSSGYHSKKGALCHHAPHRDLTPCSPLSTGRIDCSASHRAALMVLFDLTFNSTEVRALGSAMIAHQQAKCAPARPWRFWSNTESHGGPPTSFRAGQTRGSITARPRRGNQAAGREPEQGRSVLGAGLTAFIHHGGQVRGSACWRCAQGAPFNRRVA